MTCDWCGEDFDELTTVGAICLCAVCEVEQAEVARRSESTQGLHAAIRARLAKESANIPKVARIGQFARMGTGLAARVTAQMTRMGFRRTK